MHLFRTHHLLVLVKENVMQSTLLELEGYDAVTEFSKRQSIALTRQPVV